jgi:hypothetical protein
MIEIFITNIQNSVQAERISSIVQSENHDLKINFDLNETELPFPCGHTILRVEGDKINSDKLMSTMRNQGYDCEILEDKICRSDRKSDKNLGRRNKEIEKISTAFTT